jgi:hypothetical protein
MRSQQQKQNSSMVAADTPASEKRIDENILAECSVHIRVLAWKTETLHNTFLSDDDKKHHLYTMGNTLAILTARVNKLYKDSQKTPVPEILKDIRGVTYRPVRSSELDHFAYK